MHPCLNVLHTLKQNATTLLRTWSRPQPLSNPSCAEISSGSSSPEGRRSSPIYRALPRALLWLLSRSDAAFLCTHHCGKPALEGTARRRRASSYGCSSLICAQGQKQLWPQTLLDHYKTSSSATRCDASLAGPCVQLNPLSIEEEGAPGHPLSIEGAPGHPLSIEEEGAPGHPLSIEGAPGHP